MEPRRLALLVAAVALSVGGLFALVALQWRHDLGGFAENPQLLELAVGEKGIAGGRAVVGLEAATDAGATLAVSCHDADERVELPVGATSEEVCGLRVQVVAVEPGVGGNRAVLSARW